MTINVFKYNIYKSSATLAADSLGKNKLKKKKFSCKMSNQNTGNMEKWTGMENKLFRRVKVKRLIQQKSKFHFSVFLFDFYFSQIFFFLPDVLIILYFFFSHFCKEKLTEMQTKY